MAAAVGWLQPTAAYGQTAEGTVINNIATVTFTDANSNTYSSVNGNVTVTVGHSAGVDVVAAQAYTYKMISRQPGNDQSGRVQLEPLGPDKVRLHFEERFHIVGAPLRWFEGPIYRFINRKNEESMRRMSDWLTAHPEYRSDLVPSDEV